MVDVAIACTRQSYHETQEQHQHNLRAPGGAKQGRLKFEGTNEVCTRQT
jgi:hypothetical protein